jgi:polysaccharide export outer membrane protein
MARIKIVAIILVTFLTVAAESSWGQQAGASYPTAVSSQTAGSGNTGSVNGTGFQERYPRYKMQVDDVLSISFPLSPEFNQTATIQPDGYINLQGTSSVYVREMTVPDVIEALKKAYAGTLHDPIIDVDLKDFQKPFFTVLGQVGKPGQYDLRHETTVSEAVALAGGFAPSAKTQVFLFHRMPSDLVEVKKLNVKDIMHGKNVNEDARLMPGDMIFVPEKVIATFRKYVPYGVGLNPASLLYQ